MIVAKICIFNSNNNQLGEITLITVLDIFMIKNEFRFLRSLQESDIFESHLMHEITNNAGFHYRCDANQKSEFSLYGDSF